MDNDNTLESLINALTGAMSNPKAIDEMTMIFLESKGFDRSNLTEALAWIKTADPDDLMLGEGNHEDFDVVIGELRRPMLIESVERLMGKNK